MLLRMSLMVVSLVVVLAHSTESIGSQTTAMSHNKKATSGPTQKSSTKNDGSNNQSPIIFSDDDIERLSQVQQEVEKKALDVRCKLLEEALRSIFEGKPEASLESAILFNEAIDSLEMRTVSLPDEQPYAKPFRDCVENLSSYQMPAAEEEVSSPSSESHPATEAASGLDSSEGSTNKSPINSIAGKDSQEATSQVSEQHADPTVPPSTHHSQTMAEANAIEPAEGDPALDDDGQSGGSPMGFSDDDIAELTRVQQETEQLEPDERCEHLEESLRSIFENKPEGSPESAMLFSEAINSLAMSNQGSEELQKQLVECFDHKQEVGSSAGDADHQALGNQEDDGGDSDDNDDNDDGGDGPDTKGKFYRDPETIALKLQDRLKSSETPEGRCVKYYMVLNYPKGKVNKKVVKTVAKLPLPVATNDGPEFYKSLQHFMKVFSKSNDEDVRSVARELEKCLHNARTTVRPHRPGPSRHKVQNGPKHFHQVVTSTSHNGGKFPFSGQILFNPFTITGNHNFYDPQTNQFHSIHNGPNHFYHKVTSSSSNGNPAPFNPFRSMPAATATAYANARGGRASAGANVVMNRLPAGAVHSRPQLGGANPRLSSPSRRGRTTTHASPVSVPHPASAMVPFSRFATPFSKVNFSGQPLLTQPGPFRAAGGRPTTRTGFGRPSGFGGQF